MLETYITKLKKSHMTPFIIFLMMIIITFNTLGLILSNGWSDVPIMIYVLFGIWFISCLIIMKQDSYNNIKVDKFSALRYLLVNLYAGYIQLVAFTAGYILGNAYTHWNVLNYWLWVQFAIFISFLGLVLFCINEFHIVVKNTKTSLNVLAILLKLISITLIIYISIIAPEIGEETLYIWSVIIVLIVIDAFLIRSFFFYSLVVGTLNGDFEQPEMHL